MQSKAMSWFNLNVNESLSTLKGQLSNVSNVVQEVFTEGILEENPSIAFNIAKTGELDDELLQGLETANITIDELNSQCESKDKEIQELRKRIDHLMIQSDSTSRTENVIQEAQQQPNFEDSWFWEPEKSLSSVSSKENDGPSASEQAISNLIAVPSSTAQVDTDTTATGDERRIVEKLRRSSNEKDVKIQQLFDQNSALKDLIKQSQEDGNKKLEELDQQHNETIQGLIDLKKELSLDLTKLREDQNSTNLRFQNLFEDHKSLSSTNNELIEHYESLKVKYKESIDENRQLSDQVNELQSQLSIKIAESTDLNRILEEKETVSRDGSDEFEKIDIEKDKLSNSSEVNRLQTELDEINERLSILNDIKDQYDMNVFKLGSVVAERNELEEQVTKIQAINNELLEEVRVTREAVEKLELLQKNLDEINSEKEQNEAALVALQEDDMVLQREFDQLKADKEKLVSELNSTKSSQVELITFLEDKCMGLATQLGQLETDYSDLQTIHKQCEQRCQDLQIMHDTLKSSAVDLESNLVEENMLAQKQVIDLQSALNSRNVKNESDVESVTLNELERIVSKNLNYISSTPNNSIKTFLEEFLRSVKETYQHFEDIEINRDNLMKQFETVSTEKVTIEHEYMTLKADLHHYEAEVAELMKNNGMLLNELESVKTGKLETISEHNEDNILRLENQIEDCSKSNRKLQDEIKNTLRKLDECEEEKIELSENINALKNQMESQSETIQELRFRIEDSEEEKSNLRLQLDQMRTDDSKLEVNKGFEEKIRSQSKKIVVLTECIDELKVNNVELSEQVDCLLLENESFRIQIKQLEQSKSEENNMLSQLQADYEFLQSELVTIKLKNKSLSDELNSLKKTINSAQNNESSITKSLEESKQKIEKLEKENLELVNAIQLKHNENVQYHAKIQEQNQILIGLQQTIAAQNEKLSKCSECTQLNEKLDALHQENLKLIDQITFLKEKSTLSQNNLKLLEQTKIQTNEEKQILVRDLTRLRQHLIEMESAHTAEMIELQNNLELTRQEMSAMQEEARKSNTAYTSASIRANQHTETLQAQYAVLQQQKDDLSAKLSEADDRESKNRAALINLQCVLEQFQKDKERDIEARTNRIRSELNEEFSKRQSILNEIQRLKSQLDESKAGLLAAARISDQLEIAQVTNSAIKEELRKTQDKLHMTEEKFRDVESNQADRVDKLLLKNLLIGYIVAPNNDKQQILKLISSVLDFNQQESNKVGLNKSHSSWLNSIMNPGAGESLDQNQSGNYNKDSVVAAFVKFLEYESQPRSENDEAPALLNISSSSPNEDSKTATVQPVLLPGEVLRFNAPRNSSSILKDILSDT